MRSIPIGLILMLIVGYCVVYILNKSGYELGSERNLGDAYRRETERSQPPSNHGSEVYLKDLEQCVFAEINRQRREHGLTDLIWHENLAHVARAHSYNMGIREFFDHTDPIDGDLKSRMEKMGLMGWRRCGENILMESITGDPARSAVEGWMNSPGHRQNILNPGFTHTGIGAAIGRDNLLYFTQGFLLPI